MALQLSTPKPYPAAARNEPTDEPLFSRRDENDPTDDLVALREVARRCLDLYEAAAESALRAAGAEHPEVYARPFVALFDGYGLHRIAGGDDQGFEDALMALWAAATRATGTR